MGFPILSKWFPQKTIFAVAKRIHEIARIMGNDWQGNLEKRRDAEGAELRGELQALDFLSSGFFDLLGSASGDPNAAPRSGTAACS